MQGIIKAGIPAANVTLIDQSPQQVPMAHVPACVACLHSLCALRARYYQSLPPAKLQLDKARRKADLSGVTILEVGLAWESTPARERAPTFAQGAAAGRCVHLPLVLRPPPPPPHLSTGHPALPPAHPTRCPTGRR